MMVLILQFLLTLPDEPRTKPGTDALHDGTQVSPTGIIKRYV